MAATYNADFDKARDRVRLEVFDVAAPFRFQDEVIAYRLSQAGFVGSATDITTIQEQAEIMAAIALIESVPSSTSSTGASVTIKQGSVTRTSSDGSLGSYDRSGILKSLRARLNVLAARETGDNGGPVVVDGFANPCRVCG